MKTISAINPLTGQTIATYQAHSEVDIDAKISSGQQAWQQWKTTDLNKRQALMLEASRVLLKRKEELARLMALEMGKPLAAGISEIEKCAYNCEYYAENASAFLADELIDTEASKSYVSFQPLGLILAIMPWNFPFWQLFRFLAPALMAGNCAVLKHSSNVPGCALAMEEVIKEAGFPSNVFQTLLIGSEAVEQVIEHPFIKAVTLTGSTEAGMAAAQKAGSLLKKTVLELGGSDPYIILPDANIETAAETCVNSRLINSGQSCIAAKRFIVHKDILEEFTSRFKEKMAAKIVGDPLAAATDVGPLARQDLRDQVHKQVVESIAKGASCILGGSIPENSFAFYPPTILTNVKKGMPAYDDEVFGPVAAIITAEDEEEAISIANDTAFGLGAAIFTNDMAKAEHIARNKLNAGSCFVNSFVKSDPRLPFGGINQSGYGRELGVYGIKEFVNIKTVYIK